MQRTEVERMRDRALFRKQLEWFESVIRSSSTTLVYVDLCTGLLLNNFITCWSRSLAV